jgi:undecaprenyl diphosphate synthase
MSGMPLISRGPGSPSANDEPQARAMPRHVAIIMDGNGRWAKTRGEVRWEGHSAGAKAVRRTLETACRIGLPYLTLYAFSVNNWRRPRLEVEALMRLLKHFAEKERAELIEKNVRVEVVGKKDDLPRGTLAALETLMQATRHCTGTTLTLALSYGGRSDVTLATRAIAERVARGEMKPEEITEEVVRRAMSTRTLPDVDLLIRTGGESRVSDFLLLEAAYAELYFSPVMWPDFGEHHLMAAIERFQGIERRYGLTSEQVAAEPETRASA